METLLQLMELKLLAKRCGFSRLKAEKPNLVLETTMEWLRALAEQIPGADGLSEAQRAEQL